MFVGFQEVPKSGQNDTERHQPLGKVYVLFPAWFVQSYGVIIFRWILIHSFYYSVHYYLGFLAPCKAYEHKEISLKKMYKKNWFLYYFRIERNMIVVTVFLLIMNQTNSVHYYLEFLVPCKVYKRTHNIDNSNQNLDLTILYIWTSYINNNNIFNNIIHI